MTEYILPLQKLIEEFTRLPGVGQKTAARYAFAVLDMTEEEAESFACAIINAKKNVKECEICGGSLSNENQTYYRKQSFILKNKRANKGKNPMFALYHQ